MNIEWKTLFGRRVAQVGKEIVASLHEGTDGITFVISHNPAIQSHHTATVGAEARVELDIRAAFAARISKRK